MIANYSFNPPKEPFNAEDFVPGGRQERELTEDELADRITSVLMPISTKV